MCTFAVLLEMRGRERDPKPRFTGRGRMQFPLSVGHWVTSLILAGLGFCPCPPCSTHPHRLYSDLSNKWVFEMSVKHLLVPTAKGS